MRLFIIEKIKALLFIVFSIFSFISLISFSSTDPGINFVGNNNEVVNMMKETVEAKNQYIPNTFNQKLDEQMARKIDNFPMGFLI